ncbi:right-handed parallel beta-helix repeat-containing protein [Thermovibrio ammonificans]
MKKLIKTVSLALAWAALSGAARAESPLVVEKNPPKVYLEKYYKKQVIVPYFKHPKLILPKKLEKRVSIPSFEEVRKRYSPEKLSKPFRKTKVHQVSLVPVKFMFFLPFEDYFLKWSKYPNLKMVILEKGNFTLEELHRIVGNRYLEKDGRHTYTLKAPMFIGEKAKLFIKGETLRLAFNPGAPIMNAGELKIVNSTVLTWDTEKNRYLPLGKIPKEAYYLYGVIPQRPHILTIRGGKVTVVGSTVKGLGYRGLFSSFGISVSQWELENKLFHSPIANLFINLSVPLKEFETPQFVELFTLHRKPVAYIVGNNLEDNFMGFYSNNTKKAVLIANILRDNFQYNVDPHDWSRNLIVGYNLIEGAHKAHGIVFSRYVTGKIFRNLCMGNHGAGVMMDRRSSALIEGNVLLGNRLGGVSLLESDNVFIEKNFIMRNGAYGVYVRNSLNAQVMNNRIRRNLGSGTEVSVINILYQSYRNLYRDPFHLAASAWTQGNSYEDNLKSAIKTFFGGIAIYKNGFKASPFIFSGDLTPYTEEILKYQNSRPVIVPGIGDPSLIRETVPEFKEAFLKLEQNLLKAGNREALVPIALMRIIEAREQVEKGISSVKEFKSSALASGVKLLIEAAQNGQADAVLELGLTALSLAEEGSPLFKEGEVLLSEAAILGSNKAYYSLYLLPILKDRKEKENVEIAFKEAQRRIREGVLLESKVWGVEPAERGAEAEEAVKLSYRKFRKLEAKFGGVWGVLDAKAERIADKAFQKKLARMEKRIKRKNVRFYRYFRWEENVLKKVGDEYLEQNPDLIRFIEKKLTISKVWRLKLKMTGKSDFEEVKPEIADILSKMNQLRPKDKQVDIEAELSRIKRRYFGEEVH